MSVDGGARTQITKEAGQSSRDVCRPTRKLMADVYSYTNKPPELFVRRTGRRASRS